jgi:transposase
MLTIGVDPHKRLLVACAVNEAAQALERWSGVNNRAGWESFLSWSADLAQPLQVAIEGTGSYGAGLARCLAARGFTVYEVNPRWTAQGRRSARRRDKSDDDDALSIARVALREDPALPLVRPPTDGPEELLAVLVAAREELLVDATRIGNRIHAYLPLLEPDYKRLLPDLSAKDGVAALLAYQPLTSSRVELAHLAAVHRFARLLGAIREDLAALTAEIEQLAKVHYPGLIAINGLGPLSAGQIVGLVGQRVFRSEAHFAAYTGASPIQASSAGKTRHRLSRFGNRKLNAVLYRAAMTQCRSYQPAKEYVRRRQQDGLTYREALRCLKRFLARRIYHALFHPSPPVPLLVQPYG